MKMSILVLTKNTTLQLFWNAHRSSQSDTELLQLPPSKEVETVTYLNLQKEVNSRKTVK